MAEAIPFIYSDSIKGQKCYRMTVAESKFLPIIEDKLRRHLIQIPFTIKSWPCATEIQSQSNRHRSIELAFVVEDDCIPLSYTQVKANK